MLKEIKFTAGDVVITASSEYSPDNVLYVKESNWDKIPMPVGNEAENVTADGAQFSQASRIPSQRLEAFFVAVYPNGGLRELRRQLTALSARDAFFSVQATFMEGTDVFVETLDGCKLVDDIIWGQPRQDFTIAFAIAWKSPSPYKSVSINGNEPINIL